MGSRGDAYDNAQAESFMSTLKTELVDRRFWPTRNDARQAIFDYIEGWYNPRGRHSALGHMSPADHEKITRRQRRLTKSLHPSGSTPPLPIAVPADAHAPSTPPLRSSVPNRRPRKRPAQAHRLCTQPAPFTSLHDANPRLVSSRRLGRAGAARSWRASSTRLDRQPGGERRTPRRTRGRPGLP